MKLIKAFIIAVGIILATSCASPLSTRMNDYIEEVESTCEDWTSADWELSRAQYELLIEEYKLNYETYTPEEREAINKAIGRYNGLLIRHGIEEVGGILKEFGERLPSLLEGFMSAFDSKDKSE